MEIIVVLLALIFIKPIIGAIIYAVLFTVGFIIGFIKWFTLGCLVLAIFVFCFGVGTATITELLHFF